MDTADQINVPDSNDLKKSPTDFGGNGDELKENKLTSGSSVDPDKYESQSVKDENTDVNQDDEILTLTDFPIEVLFHIASFLDSRDIIRSFGQVCTLFRDLFCDEKYWKSRISQRWPQKYPLIERDDFIWSEGCMEREETANTWSDPSKTTSHFMFDKDLIAAVDCVHLLKGRKILAAGSRDRSLNILDLNKFDAERPNSKKDCLVFSDNNTHLGWVWSMTSCDSILATGSWDSKIRLWDLGEGEPRLQTDFRCKSALLSLHLEPGFVAAGGFDKKLYMFDPRDFGSLVFKRYHACPVLSVVADDKYVIAASEDSTISVFDRHAGKKIKQIQLNYFAMDLSYGNNELWFGDKQGNLNVMDTKDGLFDNIQTLDVGTRSSLSGVRHTKGAVFICGTDGLVKVVQPTFDPEITTTLKAHTASVARVDYSDGILASAGSDNSVGIWIPKPGYL